MATKYLGDYRKSDIHGHFIASGDWQKAPTIPIFQYRLADEVLVELTYLLILETAEGVTG